MTSDQAALEAAREECRRIRETLARSYRIRADVLPLLRTVGLVR